MAKAVIVNHGETEQQVWIFCPGCKEPHAFTTKHPGPFIPWTWNGDVEKPTFDPSLLCHGVNVKRCHSFVRDGKIQFLSDCDHELKNRIVDLPENNFPNNKNNYEETNP